MSERMVQEFMEMVRIDSESGNEERFLRDLAGRLTALGGDARFDAYGNLVARFPAQGCVGKEPILLSCHGDTVKPGVGIEPVLEDGVIRSAGDTILGADDKAGIAEVMEALRTAPVHPPIEFAISRQEEVGLHGVKNLDFSLITAKRGFLMDNDVLETIVIGGPSYFAIDVEISGKAAHAGMDPEKGVSAIQAASRAIAALPLGRIDHETTANVGIIAGGLIRNGVPDKTTFAAECRSANHEKGAALAATMKATIEREAASNGCWVEVQVNELCRAVRIAEDAATVKIAIAALKEVGIDAKPIFITGFTDASIYNNRGIEMAVVGIGAKDEHSTTESVAVADMEKAVAMLHAVFRICAA